MSLDNGFLFTTDYKAREMECIAEEPKCRVTYHSPTGTRICISESTHMPAFDGVNEGGSREEWCVFRHFSITNNMSYIFICRGCVAS